DAFLADILAHPDDDTPRLVYADWLMERDDPRGNPIARRFDRYGSIPVRHSGFSTRSFFAIVCSPHTSVAVNSPGSTISFASPSGFRFHSTFCTPASFGPASCASCLPFASLIVINTGFSLACFRW